MAISVVKAREMSVEYLGRKCELNSGMKAGAPAPKKKKPAESGEHDCHYTEHEKNSGVGAFHHSGIGIALAHSAGLRLGASEKKRR